MSLPQVVPQQSATLTVCASVLARIVAVHKCASDADRSSPTLSGVLVRISSGNQLMIAATDNKLLVRETYNTTSQAIGDEPLDMIMGPEAVKSLADLLKSTKDTKREWELSLSLVGKVLTVTHPKGASVAVRMTEGTFPAFKRALVKPVNSPVRPLGDDAKPIRFGLNLDYLTRLAQCWGKDAGTSCVAFTMGRGFHIEPLNHMGGSRIALLMPIVLPG